MTTGTWTRLARLFSYVFFGVALIAFLGGLVPALFLGEPMAALISAVIAIGAMLIALLLGWAGFGRDEPVSPETASGSTDQKPATKDATEARWRPEDMPMDEENWLRIHGGPGNKGQKHQNRRKTGSEQQSDRPE